MDILLDVIVKCKININLNDVDTVTKGTFVNADMSQ